MIERAGRNRHFKSALIGDTRRNNAMELELWDMKNAPGGIRTHDLRFRKPSLYPAELRALVAAL